MSNKTPLSFVQAYMGKSIDFDHTYGVQCVDGFRVFCQWALGTSWPTVSGNASGYWFYRNRYSNYFDFVSPGNLRNGDWVIWNMGSRSHPASHVAMYYNGQEFSQNQGGNRGFCLKPTNFADALGGLRWKEWRTTTAVKTSSVSNTNELKVAHGYNKAYNRIYKTTARLNIREGHSTACRSLAVLPTGTSFRCYGYYDGSWLYGVAVVGKKTLTGFCHKGYLK